MDECTFLVKDYELRIDYLNAHFSRMWTRFNFFLTLQSGLIAFMFVGNKTDFSANLPLFLLAEIVLSIIWWIFGAQDRWLAHAYRTSINETAEKIAKKDWAGDDYQAVGDNLKLFKKESPAVLKNPIEWYSRITSITRLAAYFPLILLLVWLLFTAINIYISEGLNAWEFYAVSVGILIILLLLAKSIIATRKK